MESTLKNIGAVDPKRLQALAEKADAYSHEVARVIAKKDYSRHESALAIISDSAYQEEVTTIAKTLSGALHVVLIGIGGSSLGVEAVYRAVAMQTNPRLHILDAIEPEALSRLLDILDSLESKEEIAICIISKSGNTTETITNATLFIEAAEKRFGIEVRERIVCIGTEGSDFLVNAEKQIVRVASIPQSIGGRYSVFTAAGIVPLTMLGIDVVGFREGALKALRLEARQNIVDESTNIVHLAEQGMHTINFFTFNERLRMLGFWYRQLVAESIGKKMTTKGATFSHQLLPTVATSVDLHSMAQLYLGGYQGMFTHFVYGDTESEHHKLTDHWLMSHMTILEEHTPQEVQNAIREGVLKAYDDQKLPYRLTYFDKITSYEIGQMMATLMFEVMCIGELFDVDVFDQPNVESYKKHTRELLNK